MKARSVTFCDSSAVSSSFITSSILRPRGPGDWTDTNGTGLMTSADDSSNELDKVFRAKSKLLPISEKIIWWLPH